MKDKARESTDQRTKPLSEAADKAMKNCEQAVRTGLKLQEEAAHLWTNLLKPGAAPQDWQKQFSSAGNVANGILPAAQKHLEEVIELVEQNTKASTDLMKKAAEACQTTTLPECQAKWLDLCTASADLARSNVEAVTQINSRAVDSWIDFVRKNADVTKAHAPRTS
jgi:hypothetical protein